ncbi:wax ester/triacylglycerol synthase family O-acyltransferase [Gandjariella thermophila]|uniref:Diacylglycerol O-acyltransferase n=1 Tax=Gandjariella thermophila TaxID=1931992 RepID=A0A4D4J535_9PSEU|nr:wax ester/triacylglycerol synthase family O-acyltransferase [Gandjariella thermophila]GDY29719.1 diacylglycerol O-acyltransferase [Gandjariella thermophila]
MTTEQLGALDVAFLCLEDTIPMHMGAVVTFRSSQPVHPARLTQLLGERAERMPRLRRHIRTSWTRPGAAFWSDDPDFRIDDHVRAHHLHRGDGEQQLTDLVAELMAEPLDLTAPPWQLHVITGLGGGRFAVLVKLHHALCDGAGAIGLGMGLLDGFDPPVPPVDAPEPPESSPLLTALRSAREVFGLPNRVLGTVLDAAAGLPGAVRQAGDALGIASSVLRSARSAPAMPLAAVSGPGRQVELLRIDLADVQRIRRSHGGTVNDVLLAVMAGALRHWLIGRGHFVDDLTLRALIPVSTRLRGGDGSAGNQLSGYLCDLPVGEPDPVARLRAIRAEMDRNKATGTRRGPGAIPVLADALPAALHRLVTPLVGRCAPLFFDTMITNVPLPAIPLHLDGAELQELYPLAPLAPDHALGIALSRYRDAVHVGLHACRAALPDLERLGEAVTRALTDLQELPEDQAAAR